MKKLMLYIYLCFLLMVLIGCSQIEQTDFTSVFLGESEHWNAELKIKDRKERSELIIIAKYKENMLDLKDAGNIRLKYTWLHKDAEIAINEFGNESLTIQSDSIKPISVSISSEVKIPIFERNLENNEFVEVFRRTKLDETTMSNIIHLVIRWGDLEEVMQLEKL